MGLIRIGFTGTQSGMTSLQFSLLASYLDELQQEGYTHLEIHHGDCIGADEEFHRTATSLWPEGKVRVVLHPPSNTSKRAYCSFRKQRTLAPLPYLERNRAIVDAVDRMLAAPKGMSEELRSGTWATIRYARKSAKPPLILWPN